MKIYVGTSGYAYKEWKGRFYPEKIDPKEMLRSYSEHLGAVEINNTFYHMPTEKVLESWVDQVPEDFRFAFKAPRIITHFKRLRNVESEARYLFAVLSVLEKKLAAVLLQFPGNFHADFPALEAFLDLVPDHIPCAFEFRSPSWLNGEVLGLLRKRGYSLCTSDSDEIPSGEIVSTACWGYVRLRRAGYVDADLSEWEARILSQEWQRAFVFFKHEEEAKGPELAMRLQGSTRQRKE